MAIIINGDPSLNWLLELSNFFVRVFMFYVFFSRNMKKILTAYYVFLRKKLITKKILTWKKAYKKKLINGDPSLNVLCFFERTFQ
jgi:hypothetical protein